MYTFSFIVGNIIPKSVKCIHSATKKGFRACSSKGFQGSLKGSFRQDIEGSFEGLQGFLYGLVPGLLSNQGEKSINFYSIMAPLRKKSINSKAQERLPPRVALGVTLKVAFQGFAGVGFPSGSSKGRFKGSIRV